LRHFDDPAVAAVQGIIRDRLIGEPERSSGRLLRPVHLWGHVLHARGLLRTRIGRWLAGRTRSLSDHVERIPRHAREVEALGATATLFRADALAQVGGFDERIFMYGEDQDLSARLTGHGWKLLTIPTEWATHAAGASSAGRWERELAYWNGVLTYGALHWSSTAWVSARVAGFLEVLVLGVSRPRRFPLVYRRVVAVPGRERRTSRRR
jgi:GT2 family glycosyltransferase